MGFYAVFDRIVPAQNKYMATLWNGGANRKVVVNRVYRFNWQVTAVVGVVLEQELRRVSARTVGTSVAIFDEDTVDAPTTGIVCDTGSTAVTDSDLIRRLFAASEEHAALSVAYNEKDLYAQIHDAQIVYWRQPGSKGIVLREGQGLSVKNITSSTVGSVSYVFEFEDLAA